MAPISRHPDRSPPGPRLPAVAAPWFLGLLLLAVAACGGEEPRPEFVARVGDSYLTHEELSDALAALPPHQDSTEAAHQLVEQWVTNELLYREALDQGLNQDPDVRHLLEESERSVLVSAFISRMYEEQEAAPSPAETQAYFERHKEQLRLLEPFVRVNYLATEDAEAAEEVRQHLAAAPAEARDSVWTALVSRYAADDDGSLSLSSNYYPESRLFVGQPVVRAALGRLQSGQTAPVVETNGVYHVLQLVERIPAGTIPRPEWIQDELMRRLHIQARKQMYARQVQRLRNEALAREHLEVR